MEKDPVTWYETSIVEDGNPKREHRQCPVKARISSAFRRGEESRAYLVTGGAAKNISTADMIVRLNGTYSEKTNLLELLMFSVEGRSCKLFFYCRKLSHKR
jgi:hypothetical protein